MWCKRKSIFYKRRPTNDLFVRLGIEASKKIIQHRHRVRPTNTRGTELTVWRSNRMDWNGEWLPPQCLFRIVVSSSLDLGRISLGMAEKQFLLYVYTYIFFLCILLYDSIVLNFFLFVMEKIQLTQPGWIVCCAECLGAWVVAVFGDDGMAHNSYVCCTERGEWLNDTLRNSTIWMCVCVWVCCVELAITQTQIPFIDIPQL